MNSKRRNLIRDHGLASKHNWKIRSLDDRASCDGDGKQKLIGKAASNIKDAIRRQMNMVHFFVDDQAEDIVSAPL